MRAVCGDGARRQRHQTLGLPKYPEKFAVAGMAAFAFDDCSSCMAEHPIEKAIQLAGQSRHGIPRWVTLDPAASTVTPNNVDWQ